MLQFYYDFMCRFVSRSDFIYCYMDTDSGYMAISQSCLADVIKPNMRSEFEQGLKGYCHDIDVVEAPLTHWFPRTCCQKHADFDKRTPLLFKLEYEGDEMISLCSKTYVVSGDNGHVKFSCKGVNSSSVTAPLPMYINVLQNQATYEPVNRGFRVKDNMILTYEQTRNALSYFYCKRRVLEDGIHTAPLDIELCPETNSV